MSNVVDELSMTATCHDHGCPHRYLQHEPGRKRIACFLRDVLKLTNVDVGDGWLIFGLPPSEVAVHPSDTNDVQEFYLICDDIHRKRIIPPPDEPC